ncbi:hypothetical protein IEQ34_021870 [Dendrobium chrysotoxum]|uniref:Uncharacterized protein n=1 Tax=Dendrobium chrysotoxum TaxID=161865 RepID=A0AAV7FXI5_DENCH|nr:hypothetical protein IEQ34_021870 [Dendrobium chrysotoxum]
MTQRARDKACEGWASLFDAGFRGWTLAECSSGKNFSPKIIEVLCLHQEGKKGLLGSLPSLGWSKEVKVLCLHQEGEKEVRVLCLHQEGEKVVKILCRTGLVKRL